jgi:hypothetical protein
VASSQADGSRRPADSPGGVQVIARVGQVLRAHRRPRVVRALLAISVPVPTQRYWDLEDKLTRVLLEVR